MAMLNIDELMYGQGEPNPAMIQLTGPKAPQEFDLLFGAPIQYRRDITKDKAWDDDLDAWRKANPLPPQAAAAAAPQMTAQAPIPGMLGGNISATMPPGVGGNPPAPPPAAPPLPPAIDVGPPPGTPQVASPSPANAVPGLTDVSAQSRGPMPAGAPMPLAPPEPQGFLDKIRPFDESAKRNSGLMLALAAGFAGAPSIGTGMSRAFGNAAPFAESGARRDEALRLQSSNANLTARALLARGADPRDVAAAVRNPELMKAMVGKYFETKPAQNINGRMVRERPDGAIEVLADFSTDKNKKYEEFNTPQGKVKMEVTPEGLKPVPGFETPVLDEKDKRRLNVTDTLKLSEVGGKLQQVSNFSKSFQDQYGGFVFNKIGEASNAAGRYLPEWFAGEDRAKSAEWWQHYDRYKNVVRNELFGSALTAQEKAAFDAADIRPGMTPNQIKSNLEYQRKIVQNGTLRAGQALIEQGYEPKAIAKAYGVKPEFFDRQAEELVSGGASGTITVGGKQLKWRAVP